MDLDLSIKKLLENNQNTGIETRSAIVDHSTEHAADGIPKSLADLDHLFLIAGVDLTVEACKKALQEWEGQLNEMTHTVAVTCTNQGNPGYDVLVDEKLGSSTSVKRILLQGVGCAGGLLCRSELSETLFKINGFLNIGEYHGMANFNQPIPCDEKY